MPVTPSARLHERIMECARNCKELKRRADVQSSIQTGAEPDPLPVSISIDRPQQGVNNPPPRGNNSG